MEIERGDKLMIDTRKGEKIDSDYENCEKDFIEVEVTHEMEGSDELGVKPVDESFSFFLFLYADESCLACTEHQLIYHDSEDRWFCPFCDS